MNRSEAIDHILKKHPNCAIVICNGLNSRETSFNYNDNNHLYLLHGMGEALSVGIGLKLGDMNLDVVIIDGDGNALMGMSSWSLLPIKGIYYYVLDNGMYETTGGQTTPKFRNIPEYINIIKISPGKIKTPNPPDPKEIMKKFSEWYENKI